jgi:hypothetical protein
MNSKSDELRSQLPLLAGEMSAGIRDALAEIRAARKLADQPDAWRKGVDDALRLMRPAEEAHQRFIAWIEQVLAQEVDHCGLTAAEREAVFGPKYAH